MIEYILRHHRTKTDFHRQICSVLPRKIDYTSVIKLFM